MFGKIKDRLKKVFESHEEIIEQNPDEIIEVEVEEQVKDKIVDDESVEEKRGAVTIKDSSVPSEDKKSSKGFFSKVFGKKEDKDVEELTELQDEMLEGAPEEEIIAIKQKKELKDTNKNKEELEKRIAKEEAVEREELVEVKKDKISKKEESKLGVNLPSPKSDKEILRDYEEHYDDVKEEPVVKEGFFSKTIQKLKAKTITDDDFVKIWVELEIFLLEINIAYEIVQNIEIKLKDAIIGNSFDRFNLTKKIREVLVNEVEKVLKDREGDLLSEIKALNDKGEIAKILVLGVNGTGKTTTIAKIVNMFQNNNISVVVAAADTFRAAAVEQLGEHAKRLNFKLIQHKGGSDPAAVGFDAIEHAKAKKLDVVLIDTAGRMPNNSNLMLELEKIKRVCGTQLSIFIGDSVSGNDLIDQINLFNKIVGIDGVVLTKTDTDERPGSVVTTAYSIEKPIYYLGIGQGYDDLVKFDAKLVAEKLFDIDDEE